MKRKWILSVIFLFSLLLKDTMTQYGNPDFSAMQQFQYNPYKNQLNLFQQYPTREWILRDNLNYEEYNDYDEENMCSCENCDELKPFCQSMCPNCTPIPSSLSGPGYVFLPFPYPYPMTTKTTISPRKSKRTSVVTTVTTTTEATTTQAATTEATTIQKSTKEISLEFAEKTDTTITDKLNESKASDVITPDKSFQVKDKSPYMLTSLRRTKPNWIPKYGIVPISNKFAEKLMLQLRSMKVLHPRKDYLRNVDEITPVN